MESLYNKYKRGFKLIGLIYHGGGVIHFTTAIIFDYQIPGEYGLYVIDRLQYMSYWNLYLQWIYFAYSTAVDVMRFNTDEEPQQPEVIDFIKEALAFPCSMFVSMIFWSMVTMDPAMIYNVEPLPRPLNHMVHTNVALFNIFEYFIVKRQHCPTKTCLCIGVGLNAAFLIWFLIHNSSESQWTYPFLANLDFKGKVAFFSSCFFLSSSICVLGQKFHKLVWGDDTNQARPLERTNAPIPPTIVEPTPQEIQAAKNQKVAKPAPPPKKPVTPVAPVPPKK